ncbi:MAG TPA: aspartate dehydrogenase [Burkholderiales bacterium]|nr:aspartate dehydrogenase [Burkholderiales bacterium]
MRHILLIGMGALGRHVGYALRNEGTRLRLSILVRPKYVADVRARADEIAPGEVEVVDRLEKLREFPELAVECAGHSAVADYGEACLTSGTDFLVTSVGALTDAALLQRLERASRMHVGKLLIPAGAIAGVDALAAARHGGLARVRYTSRKAPQAWRGTHAETLCDLDAIDRPVEFYRGNAGDAARLFPQNANVAATIALAGIGFDATECSLNADPAAPGNVHLIEAEGGFGQLRIEVQGKPLADNPKTSTLAALSVLRAIHNRIGAIQI